MKIPFDIKFRPQIESGEYKVETFSGYPVTIYRWDFDDGARTPIMGSYVFEDSKEYVGAWNEEGHFDLMSPNDLDLFLITPEQELSEFEKELSKCLCDSNVRPEEEDYDKWAKEYAPALLNIARKKLVDDVQLQFDDEINEAYYRGRKDGKAEALKDLPRWRKWGNGACGNGQGIPIAIVKRGLNGYELVDALGIQGEQYIMLSDLEKLTGFND